MDEVFVWHGERYVWCWLLVECVTGAKFLTGVEIWKAPAPQKEQKTTIRDSLLILAITSSVYCYLVLAICSTTQHGRAGPSEDISSSDQWKHQAITDVTKDERTTDDRRCESD